MNGISLDLAYAIIELIWTKGLISDEEMAKIKEKCAVTLSLKNQHLPG